MTMEYRMLPPGDGSKNPFTTNGRAYSCALGSSIDVPEADAGVLAANGWALLGPSGPTSSRPRGDIRHGDILAVGLGNLFVDTDSNSPIWWDGQAWRTFSGGAA